MCCERKSSMWFIPFWVFCSLPKLHIYTKRCRFKMFFGLRSNADIRVSSVVCDWNQYCVCSGDDDSLPWWDWKCEYVYRLFLLCRRISDDRWHWQPRPQNKSCQTMDICVCSDGMGLHLLRNYQSSDRREVPIHGLELDSLYFSRFFRKISSRFA